MSDEEKGPVEDRDDIILDDEPSTESGTGLAAAPPAAFLPTAAPCGA